MSSLGMQGPYLLNAKSIDSKVTKTSPGNYALGYSKDGKFFPMYVGRSDDDLNARLKQHIGKHKDCKEFKFAYATSPKAAFEKECQNYHDFKQLMNKVHPDRPDGTNWRCPRC